MLCAAVSENRLLAAARTARDWNSMVAVVVCCSVVADVEG